MKKIEIVFLVVILIVLLLGTIYLINRKRTHIFYSTVIESKPNYIIVTPFEGSSELKSADKISIGLDEGEYKNYTIGTTLKITYNGQIMETYPAKIHVSKIEILTKADRKEINDLDDFYNTNTTKDKDIRDLGELYNSFDAQKDNCFVIGAMVHNDYLYYEFMNNFKNNKSSFIRVAQNTIEGDLCLYDILYHEETDKLYLVTDYTRDEFAASEDRIIKLRQYEGITEYTYNENLYWILYNGELNDETFNSENVFIITLIN